MIKKSLFIIYFLVISMISLAKKPTLNEVRKLFFEAQTQEASCQKLIDLLEPYNEKNDPLYFGYKGSATIIMAKHVGNPFTKLSNFRRGSNMLEKAIAKDENNSELIFLRFAIQTHIPSFLGYHNNIQSDKQFLYSTLPKLKDDDLKEHISGYLKYIARLNKY